MKKIISIMTVSLIAIGTTLLAQSNSRLLGNTYYHSDGSSSRLLGNSTYNSDGSSSRLLGNTYYHSNGSSSRLLGNTIYNSNNKRTPSYILKDNCYPCN